MRIAVIAGSTHDKFPENLPARLKDADEIWHLGDVCERETLVELELLGKPLHVRAGQQRLGCGVAVGADARARGVSVLSDAHSATAAAPGVQLVLHGHTHVPRDELGLGARWLNPGCIARPNRGAPPSFAWLTLEKGQPLQWKVMPL